LRRASAWTVALGLALGAPLAGAAQAGPAGPRTLPESIPLFPLPDVGLFPNSTQPFRIFEPRYREMVADALAGDSIIGMVLLRPGFEDQYEGNPPIYEIGCAGIIVASQELSDGRFNILVRGLTKFRVLSEDQSRAYRRASVAQGPEASAADGRDALAAERPALERALRTAFPGAGPLPTDIANEELVNELALGLPLDPAKRQELLEAQGPVERARMLIELLNGMGRASV
jgi:uncharacterized protein